MATVLLTKGKYGSGKFVEEGEVRAMIATTRQNLITFGKAQKSHYDSFAATITQQFGSVATCAVVAGTNAAKCSLSNSCNMINGLDSIKITLDDIAYTIPASSFTMDVVDEVTGAKTCDLGVQYDENATNNIALIGLQFAQQFVTLFDYENNRLRFAMNVNAHSGVEIAGPSDTDKANDGMSTGQKFFIWMLLISFVLITGVLVVYVIRCMRKSRSRQDASAIAYQSVNDRRV